MEGDFDRETLTVGKTPPDQQRNAKLLDGYDYSKYPPGITGSTGQDLQRIAFLRWEHAARVRVGSHGNSSSAAHGTTVGPGASPLAPLTGTARSSGRSPRSG